MDVGYQGNVGAVTKNNHSLNQCLAWMYVLRFCLERKICAYKPLNYR